MFTRIALLLQLDENLNDAAVPLSKSDQPLLPPPFCDPHLLIIEPKDVDVVLNQSDIENVSPIWKSVSLCVPDVEI